MKIILDRRNCQCYDQSCETHFAALLARRGHPVDLHGGGAGRRAPGSDFPDLDKDGKDKELVVSEENRAIAYDSWREAWEQQQTKIDQVATHFQRASQLAGSYFSMSGRGADNRW